jgi:hypothetical protein
MRDTEPPMTKPIPIAMTPHVGSKDAYQFTWIKMTRHSKAYVLLVFPALAPPSGTNAWRTQQIHSLIRRLEA